MQVSLDFSARRASGSRLRFTEALGTPWSPTRPDDLPYRPPTTLWATFRVSSLLGRYAQSS